MANIYTTIQRKVNRGDFDFLKHALYELADEHFTASDAVKVILKPFNQYELTDLKSHVRYVFEGYAKDGRILAVVVFVQQGRVKIKTCYEA